MATVFLSHKESSKLIYDTVLVVNCIFLVLKFLQLAARNVLFRIHKSQSTVVSHVGLFEVLRGAEVKKTVQIEYNEDQC